MSNKRIKSLKNEVLDFVSLGDFSNWVVKVSRKSFFDGAKHYAEIDPATKTLIINPYKELIYFLPSVIHEVLHIIHPRSQEKTIRRWENEVANDLSPSEKTAFLNNIFVKGNVLWDE